MKITKRQLKRIIKEERHRLLEGARSPEMAALEAAIEALAKVDGWEEVADVLDGISDEIATGQYKPAKPSGEPMGIEDKIVAAFDQVGVAYTDHLSQDDEIFVDTEISEYSDEWDQIEKLVRAMPGVVEILVGDDGMVVEVDWDEV